MKCAWKIKYRDFVVQKPTYSLVWCCGSLISPQIHWSTTNSVTLGLHVIISPWQHILTADRKCVLWKEFKQWYAVCDIGVCKRILFYGCLILSHQAVLYDLKCEKLTQTYEQIRSTSPAFMLWFLAPSDILHLDFFIVFGISSVKYVDKESCVAAVCQ